jgi:uncharacterized membrane protein
MAPSPSPPDETEPTISELHAQHYRKATPLQQRLDDMVGRLSHPATLLVLTAIIGGWILLNLVWAWAGGDPIDPPPFPWLEGTGTLAAVYLAVLILITQSREDALERHRDQLTLELAIMSERKSAKIIELLEELRRDNPLVLNRVDDTAAAMAKPADPVAVLNAIEEVHRIVEEEKHS